MVSSIFIFLTYFREKRLSSLLRSRTQPNTAFVYSGILCLNYFPADLALGILVLRC